MRDYNVYFYRLSDDEVEAIGNLLEWKDALAYWRSLNNEDRPKFGIEISKKIVELIPSEHKPGKPIPLPYSYLLELAYFFLIAESKDAKPSDAVVDIEKEIITRLFDQIMSKATPEQKEKIYNSIRTEAQKVGLEWKLTDLAPSATLLSTIVIGQLGGFTTYILATTITASLASAIGVTLPFAFYTTLSSAISVFLGPPGWIIGGIIGLLGLGTIFSRAKDKKNKLRLLSVVTCLIQIKFRISEDLVYETATTSDTLRSMEDEILTLNELLEEQEKEIKNLQKENIDNENLKIRAEAAENQLKKLSAVMDQYKHQIEIAKRNGELDFPIDLDREIPISSGSDTSIWDVRITKLSDIPTDSDRTLFKTLMRHTNVQKIILSDYDGPSNSKPTITPILHLYKQKACLKGKILTTAKKKNACRVSIVVDSGSEDSVIRYGVVEGIISLLVSR